MIKPILFCLLLLSTTIQAQTLSVDPRTGARRIFRFQSIGPSFAPIEAGYNHLGFSLKSLADPTNMECSRITDYHIEVSLIIDQREKRLDRWQDFLNRCSIFMRGEFQLLFLSQNLSFDSVEAFEKYLSTSSISAERAKEIVEIYSLVKKPNDAILILKKIEELMLLKLEDSTSLERIRRLTEFRNLKNLANYPYLAQILELLIAIKVENQAWAYDSLLSLMNTHPFRLAFEVDHLTFNGEWSAERQEKIFLSLGLEIAQYFKKSHPQEVDIFMTIFSDFLKLRSFDSLAVKYSTDWSLVRIREGISQRVLSRKLPSFWYSQLSFRTSTSQVEIYLEELLSLDNGKFFTEDSLWFFAESFPSSDLGRETVFRLINESNPSDDYIRLLSFYLIENESLKRKLSESKTNYQRPLFQLRRDFFRSLLSRSKSRDLAIYYLIKAGDHNPNYLWHLGLKTNTGLEN